MTKLFITSLLITMLVFVGLGVPVDRVRVNNDPRSTPTLVGKTATSTPVLTDEVTSAPTSEPVATLPWGPDIQATMDADLFDNDAPYNNQCFEYVNGGGQIRYFPCDGTPAPTAPPIE